MWRRAGYVLLACGLLALLLGWSAPTWLAWVLSAQLRQAGFTQVRSEIAHVGWREMRLRMVRGRHPAGWSLAARGIVLRYRPWQLAHGRASTLVVDRFEIARRTSAHAARMTVPPVPAPSMLAALPVAHIEIAQLVFDSRWGQWQGQAQYREGALLVSMHNRHHDRCALSAHAQGAFELRCAASALHASGILDERHARLNLRVESDVARLNALVLHMGMGVDWAAQGHVSLEGRFSLANRGWDKGQARMSARLSLLQDTLGVNARGELEVEHGHLVWRLNDGATLYLGARQTRTTVRGSHLSGEVVWQDGTIRAWRLRKGGTCLLRASGDQREASATLTLLDEVHVQEDDARHLAHDVRLQAAFKLGLARRLTVSVRQMRMRIAAGPLAALRGEVAMPELRISQKQHAVRARDVHLAFHRRQASWQGKVRLALADGGLPVDGDCKWNAGQGWLRLQGEWADIARKQQAVRALLRPWLPELQLRAGRCAFQLSARWQGARLSGAMQLRVDELAGHYGTHAFSRLRGQMRLHYSEGNWRLEPAKIALAELDGGVPLERLRLRLSLNWLRGRRPVWHVYQASARLLGGELAVKPGRLDFNRSRQTMHVHVRHLDLARLVALEQRRQLQARGSLDGELPLHIDRQGVWLDEGRLHALPPGGVIRYRAEPALARRNPTLLMALGALSDFHYDHLDVRANYRPDGRLLLHVRVHGRNPSFQQGRPVELRLNLEDNMLQLLRSLRISGGIEERVRNAVERKR